ncbi:hypothetical protein HANVADRAFT_53734, partial [Hanseniaspora valbyensis NRRL Y-1626]
MSLNNFYDKIIANDNDADCESEFAISSQGHISRSYSPMQQRCSDKENSPSPEPILPHYVSKQFKNKVFKNKLRTRQKKISKLPLSKDVGIKLPRLHLIKVANKFSTESQPKCENNTFTNDCDDVSDVYDCIDLTDVDSLTSYFLSEKLKKATL